MAERSPAASTSGIRFLKLSDDEDIIKRVFSSVVWRYPVHKYIGDIVQGQYHSVNLIACRAFIWMDICVDNHFKSDYQPKHKQAYFELYCDTVRLPITFFI